MSVCYRSNPLRAPLLEPETDPKSKVDGIPQSLSDPSKSQLETKSHNKPRLTHTEPISSDGFLRKMVEMAKEAGISYSWDRIREINDNVGNSPTRVFKVPLPNGTNRSHLESFKQKILVEAEIHGISLMIQEEGAGLRGSLTGFCGPRPKVAHQIISTAGADSNFEIIMDSLSGDTQRLSLGTTWQQKPRHIALPKGYEMRMGVDASQHFNDAASIIAYNAFWGTLPGVQPEHLKYGFNPQEVLQSCALWDPSLVICCSLTGAIHPIFAKANWTDTPDHIYKFIRPALLLASKFLTVPNCMAHFATVMKGKRHRDGFCWRIAEDIPLTAQTAREAIERILALKHSITFQFSTPGKYDDHYGDARLLDLVDAPRRNGQHLCHVTLHPDYLTAAQKFSSMAYPDFSQVLRYQLILSVLLMHELAHVFEMTMSPDDFSAHGEVYMYSYKQAESGFAWETKTFGGPIYPINDRIDAAFGLYVCKWPFPDWRQRKNMFTVSMSFIQKLFTEAEWDSVRSRPMGEQKIWHVPSTGAATANELSTMTTARWSDHADSLIASHPIAWVPIENLVEQEKREEADREKLDEEQSSNKA
ncbi:hypothetical protein F5884DRAFT_365204 [Xylogone sp. PMI_703]|nr:hypothetical protein F5884DRAFT_365204 [Xylogone sp. PMI_703]